MAGDFDLTAMARGLLNIEVNTLLCDDITAEPMPVVPHALLDIIGAYADMLCDLGLDLEFFFSAPDPAKVVPRWTSECGPGVTDLTISVLTLERLRCAAVAAANNPGNHRVGAGAKSRLLPGRILNNCDAIKSILNKPENTVLREFDGATRATLPPGIQASSYKIAPDDLSRLQKIWDLGTETIFAQTITHLNGDVTTRLSSSAMSENNVAVLFDIHRQSVSISVGCWQFLLNAVREIAGAAVGKLLGSR